MADKKPYLTVNYDAMTFTVNDAEKPMLFMHMTLN